MVTHQVVSKLSIQGLYCCYIGPESRVWEQPDVSSCNLNLSQSKLESPFCNLPDEDSFLHIKNPGQAILSFGVQSEQLEVWLFPTVDGITEQPFNRKFITKTGTAQGMVDSETQTQR